jgi:hypothetical protein
MNMENSLAPSHPTGGIIPPLSLSYLLRYMPVIKKDKVDYYYDQLYVKPHDFLKTLPDLVKRNLASGDYASQ